MEATEGIEKGLKWRARRSFCWETYPGPSPVKKWLEVVHVRVSLGFRIWVGFY